MSDAPSPTQELQEPGYYILSLKWSPREGNLVWWRAGNAGYTTDLNQAGVYSTAEVARAPDYYDNGLNTLAVPCWQAERKAVSRLLAEHSVSVLADMRRYASRAKVRHRLAEGTFDGASPQDTPTPTTTRVAGKMERG